jgi:hypothetical protein
MPGGGRADCGGRGLPGADRDSARPPAIPGSVQVGPVPGWGGAAIGFAAEPVSRSAFRVEAEHPGSWQPVGQQADLLVRANLPQAVQQYGHAVRVIEGGVGGGPGGQFSELLVRRVVRMSSRSISAAKAATANSSRSARPAASVSPRHVHHAAGQYPTTVKAAESARQARPQGRPRSRPRDVALVAEAVTGGNVRPEPTQREPAGPKASARSRPVEPV